MELANEYFAEKIEEDKVSKLKYCDAPKAHNFALPCKTVTEVEAFDKLLEDAEKFKDFVSTKVLGTI